MSYIVSGMTLIPQDKDMACWYVSARMLIQWKRNQCQATLVGQADPSELSSTQKTYDDNNGISDAYIVGLAEKLGLRRVPPMTPSSTYIEDLLSYNGPLWFNGNRHIIVFAGVRNLGATEEILVYDPWPVNMGKISWRPVSELFPVAGGATLKDSVDYSTTSGIMMYLPAGC